MKTKQSYCDKAIKLAIKHGYTGGWHQPNSDVFNDERFYRAIAKGLGYHEWRTLYEKYLLANSNEIADEAFWKAEFIALANYMNTEKIITKEYTHPSCFHKCISNCRRVGCNCECGEYHGKLSLEEYREAVSDPLIEAVGAWQEKCLKREEVYYYYPHFTIKEIKCYDTDVDGQFYRVLSSRGFCFRTEKEARDAANQMIQALKK